MNAQYPLAPMAQQLQQYGRYGDSQLVHLNPIEVEMLRSMSPTGELTINPVTGQPEAFLPLLAPLIGMAGGAMGLGALGTGILTGAATAAITGDLKRGLLAGITGGLASGAGDVLAEGLGSLGAETAANTAAEQAAATVTSEFAADAAGQAASEAAMQSAATSGFGPAIAGDAGLNASVAAIDTTSQSLSNLAPGVSNSVGSAAGMASPSPWYMADSAFNQALPDVSSNMALLGTGYGVNTLSAMDYADAQQAAFKKEERDRLERRRNSYDRMMSARNAINPGFSSFGGFGMAEGGQVPTSDVEFILDKARRGVLLTPDEQAKFEEYYAQQNATRLQTAQENQEQERIDNTTFYTPDMTGMEAIDDLYRRGMLTNKDYDWFNKFSDGTDQFEWMTKADDWSSAYENLSGLNAENLARVRKVEGLIQQGKNEGFSNPDAADVAGGIANIGGGKGGAGAGRGNAAGNAELQRDLRGGQFNVSNQVPKDYKPGFEPEFSYFQDDPENVLTPDRGYRPTRQIIQRTGGAPAYAKPAGMAEGGVAEGIGALEPELAGSTDALALIPAILGQTENADEVINNFIRKYGVDRFREIRAMILDQYVAPNSQKEGMIRGAGSGMDDQVPGMIGSQQPVAVSPGEYIVPADVVSGLGDGSSDAGAKELDGMMERVRMARGGTTRQAPPINQARVMPA